jgi:UV excision repair protein RAD23
MKIAIKQLAGQKFDVDAEASDSVAELKTKIHNKSVEIGGDQAVLVAERQKLIYKGKILKDSNIVGEVEGIDKEDTFIVCMMQTTKSKAAAPAPAPTPSVSSSSTASAPAAAAATTTSTPVAASSTSAPTPAAAAAPAVQDYVTEEGLAALTAMGYPEAESRATLQAAMGDPNVAVEFLMNGIPPQIAQMQAAAAAGGVGGGADVPPPAVPVSAATGIEALRNHPQLNALRQTVQQNPGALPQVLQVIGQQQPELLQAIHENEAAFLEMMNEPVSATPPAAPATGAAGVPGGMPDMGGMGGNPLANPAAMMAMLSQLPEAQRAEFAQQMGISPDQLNQLMTVFQSMPPEQLQEMMARGPGGNGGGPPPGSIALTAEEMESVTRLQALGYSQAQAAQAFLACDKNETMAANALMDGTFDDDAGPGGDDMYS